MKIQKKQAIGENLLYVMVWTAIILVPVLNSQMMSEMHVNLENVLTAWRYIAPYLIIFLIHNAIIAPRYMLRRKYGKYLASNLALIISVFARSSPAPAINCENRISKTKRSTCVPT